MSGPKTFKQGEGARVRKRGPQTIYGPRSREKVNEPSETPEYDRYDDVVHLSRVRLQSRAETSHLLRKADSPLAVVYLVHGFSWFRALRVQGSSISSAP